MSSHCIFPQHKQVVLVLYSKQTATVWQHEPRVRQQIDDSCKLRDEEQLHNIWHERGTAGIWTKHLLLTRQACWPAKPQRLLHTQFTQKNVFTCGLDTHSFYCIHIFLFCVILCYFGVYLMKWCVASPSERKVQYPTMRIPEQERPLLSKGRAYSTWSSFFWFDLWIPVYTITCTGNNLWI